MNLNVFSPIGYTGYGVAGFNLIKRLRNDYNISLFPPSNNISCDNEEDKVWLRECVKNQDTFDNDAQFFKLWHQGELALRVGKGQYTAMTLFELNAFTNRELQSLKCPDKLIVCSKWAKDIAKEQTDIDAYVVPLGVDRTIFHENRPIPQHLKRDKPTCIFLNVGKWEKRKGHDFLIECFEASFSRNDDCELWLCPFNPFISKEQEQEWMGRYHSKLDNKIKILNRLAKQTDVADLMAASTIGIFPSRGEGFGLESLEMLSMNKNIVITNYSAHKDYCDNKNSMLINIDKLETAEDGVFFHSQGEWAHLGKPQMEQTVTYLRGIYDSFHTTGIEENKAGIETAKNFSWENSASKLREILISP